MNKKVGLTFLVIILTITLVAAQKKTVATIKDFKNLIGCWQGALHYSGTIIRKPYSTTADLVVRQIDKFSAFEFLHIYTKDSTDNVADTIFISKNGRKLNQRSIKSRRHTGEGKVEIITEALGFDHDNDKAATIREIYTIGKNSYSYKKTIRLIGQSDWLDRKECTYQRSECKGKSEK